MRRKTYVDEWSSHSAIEDRLDDANACLRTGREGDYGWTVSGRVEVEVGGEGVGVVECKGRGSKGGGEGGEDEKRIEKHVGGSLESLLPGLKYERKVRPSSLATGGPLIGCVAVAMAGALRAASSTTCHFRFSNFDRRQALCTGGPASLRVNKVRAAPA
jgi:hypothetical protein